VVAGAALLRIEGVGDGETAPEAASGLAAAVPSAATTASSGVSRESTGWSVDGAADGGATGEEASGGADGEELEREPSKAEEAPSATSDVAAAAGLLLRWTIGEGERLLLRDDDGE